jgi:hypothetical protein
MLYSALLDAPVILPLDGAAYEAKLTELIETSTFVKKIVETDGPADLGKSFNVV